MELFTKNGKKPPNGFSLVEINSGDISKNGAKIRTRARDRFFDGKPYLSWLSVIAPPSL